MEKTAKIYVSGHSGLVGGALVRELEAQGYNNLLLRTHKELDLLDQKAVADFFDTEKPEYVFHVAAKVGGMMGNKLYPADFMYDNINIQTTVIHNAHRTGVKKLLFFGSICIYPVQAPVPVKEEYLLTGPLEYTNEGYAIAKITGLMMCKKYKEQYGDNFISVMPSNLYGINDNFHPVNSHVIPGLMRRMHEAKLNGDSEFVVWGTGKPTRDFLFADDVASGLILCMNEYNDLEQINIGPGVETSIGELALLIQEVVGYEGKIVQDTSKPDGTPRRYLDTTKITNLGWKPTHTLKEGLTKTYEWYVEALAEGKIRSY